MSSDTQREESGGLSRRQILARGAVAAGVAWAAPIIRTTAAYATSAAGTERPCSHFFAIVITRNRVWKYFPTGRPHFPPGWNYRWWNRQDMPQAGPPPFAPGNDPHLNNKGGNNKLPDGAQAGGTGAAADRGATEAGGVNRLPSASTAGDVTGAATGDGSSSTSSTTTSSTTTSSTTTTSTTTTTSPVPFSTQEELTPATGALTATNELPPGEDFGKIIGADLPDPQPPSILDWAFSFPDIDLDFPDNVPLLTQTSNQAWAVLLPHVGGPNRGARQCRLVTGIYKNGSDFGAEAFVDPNPPAPDQRGRRILFPCTGGYHGGYTGHDGQGLQPGHSKREGDECVILVFCCP